MIEKAARVVDIRKADAERRLKALNDDEADCADAIRNLQRALRQRHDEILALHASRQETTSALVLSESAIEARRIRNLIDAQQAELEELEVRRKRIEGQRQTVVQALVALECKRDFLQARRKAAAKKSRRRREGLG